MLHALVVVADPVSGRREIGVHEKGIAALESLLFAKYQIFRNVYWHHAVRAATVMYTRIVARALADQLIASDELVGQTDEGLLHLLEARTAASSSRSTAAVVREQVSALRSRRLPKRAGEIVAGELEASDAEPWLAGDSPLKHAVEDQLARELDLDAGGVFLDFPEKGAMFHLNLLVLRRSGEVMRLGPAGQEGLIGLPSVAEELYRTARVLRMFTWPVRRSVATAALRRIAGLGEAEVQAELRSGLSFLR
jgi:hypothetical protein